ncbi:MAG: anti-sigma factor [Phycisphaerales bacterium]
MSDPSGPAPNPSSRPPPTPPDASRPGEGPWAWLDLYLDGALDDERRAEFESAMARDAALRDAVTLQRSLDLELRSAFTLDPSSLTIAGVAAPDRHVAEHAGETSGPAPLARIGPWRSWILGIAAVIALCAAGLWSYTMTRGDGPRYIEPAELYARLKFNGFKPEFVCTTDEEFNAAVTRRLGSGLLVAHAPDIELLGWAYGNDYLGQIVGPKTLVLMCKLDQKEHVIVLMDQASSDRTLTLPPDSGLNIFRRRVGPLVLYEVTPLDEQRVLPHAYEPK